MPADFRREAEGMFASFRERQGDAGRKRDTAEAAHNAFLTEFENLVNDPIAEYVTDIRAVAGDDAAVEVTSDQEGRTWFQVTITAKLAGADHKQSSVRFVGNYPARTVSIQNQDAAGRYCNVNGDLPIQQFQGWKVARPIKRALEEALNP